MKKIRLLLIISLLIAAFAVNVSAQDTVTAEPGQELDMVFLPKTLGNVVFEIAHNGAMEAHAELGNTGELIFNAPTPENAIPGQIEIIESAITQGVDSLMISANDFEQLVPSTSRALEEGITVVTWDSPIAADGQQLFIAQVDFSEAGAVMGDMALNILGEEGGQVAILSATPDASNQNAWIAAFQETLANDPAYANLELVDIVYGNDDPDDSYNEALGLVDSYPDLDLIMAPTTVGIAAAAKAMQDEGLCGEVAVSGLGLPIEMQEFIENGCAEEFALWRFDDLGYLAYYASYLLATDAMEAEAGVTFEAGRLGSFTIEETDNGLQVLLGPWAVFNADNYDTWAITDDEESGDMGDMGDVVVAEPGQALDMVFLPKTLGNVVFEIAHNGAIEAHSELENSGELIFNAPTPENAIPGQIEIIESAITQGVASLMISANDFEQLVPSTSRALEEGITVVTWDSPIAPEGQQLFIAQVDFSEAGAVMGDMALNILGEEGGQVAILSATPDASNQNAWIAAFQETLETDPAYANLELVDIVYGNDDPDDSYNKALGLVDSYPDLDLIMAPTTVGIAAAAKAMQDEGLCEQIGVSGLGLPIEMQEFIENGCAEEFALWRFDDLGYLAYYASYLLATDAMEAEAGVTFEAGRLGTYTIEETDNGLQVLLGPWAVFNADNYDTWAVTDE